jgi:hypothetical protein
VSYSGWTNYETWNAALWVDNDQGTHEYFQERAQTLFDEAEGEDSDERERSAEQALKDEFMHWFCDPVEEANIGGWMLDAINSYLSEVNWMELAEHYLCDIDKD